jgi:hypothetical protein
MGKLKSPPFDSAQAGTNVAQIATLVWGTRLRPVLRRILSFPILCDQPPNPTSV